MFEKRELIIASCLHPKFKLNWLNGNDRKNAEHYLLDLLGIHSNESSVNYDNDIEDDDFFMFNKQTIHNESTQDELQRFLKSTITEVEMLKDYPTIKKFFIEYNTALPSSASVERLFSISGLILMPQRSRLDDNTVEQQLLLKINKEYF